MRARSFELLLDRTALLFPLGRRVEHRAHA